MNIIKWLKGSLSRSNFKASIILLLFDVYKINVGCRVTLVEET